MCKKWQPTSKRKKTLQERVKEQIFIEINEIKNTCNSVVMKPVTEATVSSMKSAKRIVNCEQYVCKQRQRRQQTKIIHIDCVRCVSVRKPELHRAGCASMYAWCDGFACIWHFEFFKRQQKKTRRGKKVKEECERFYYCCCRLILHKWNRMRVGGRRRLILYRHIYYSAESIQYLNKNRL